MTEPFRVAILRKILREKVVTETDLLYLCGGYTHKLEDAYRYFITVGYPIKRRILDQKFKHGKTHSPGTFTRVNHRVRIYYLI